MAGPIERWWEHPARPCKGREEYADTTLVRGAGRGMEIEDMRQSCHYCPVLEQCGADVLMVDEPPRGAVRAAQIFR